MMNRRLYKHNPVQLTGEQEMAKITQIQTNKLAGRVSVYIDYHFCAAIRQNIWDEMNLHEGSEISRTELHKQEAAIWKKYKRPSSRHPIQQTINRIVQWFSKYLPDLEAKIVDFRLDYNNDKMPSNYSSTRNDQNISLFLKGTAIEVITLEVAVAEIQRGTNYSVKADKIVFAQSQLQKDVWVVLYCKYPMEKFIWIKPSNKEYKHEELIGVANSHFIAFSDESPEVYSSQRFYDYIQKKISEKA